MRWTRTLGLVLVALWLVLTGIFAFLTLSAAFDKDSSGWARILVVMVNVAALLVALTLAEDVVVPGRRFRNLLRPKPIAALYAASFSAAGVVAGLLGLLAPKNATVRDLDQSTRAIVAAINRQDVAGADAPVRRQIVGHWGDSHCALVYDFAVDKNALVVETIKWPRGDAKWRSIFSIERGTVGNTMQVVAQTPQENRGHAASFAYAAMAGVEALDWIDRRDGPQRYRRC